MQTNVFFKHLCIKLVLDEGGEVISAPVKHGKGLVHKEAKKASKVQKSELS